MFFHFTNITKVYTPYKIPHITSYNNSSEVEYPRDVTKTSSCWVYAIIRWEKQQLGRS